MDESQRRTDDQSALWNGPAARGWIDAQPLLDSVLQPFEDLLVATIPADSAEHVLDVGCGAGATTLAAARVLGARGRSVGIDISEPLIALARVRAERERANATFIAADAQPYPFEPASFDRIISRFGVMFFDDAVRAFANLRRAAREGAELRFVAWRGPDENPFMTAAERTAAPLLPDLPARPTDAPGQFGLADPSRTRRILRDGGWRAIDVEPIDVACTLPESELIRYLTLLGPVGMKLQTLDERTRREVIDTVRPAFDGWVHGDTVRFNAACWLVRARAAA